MKIKLSLYQEILIFGHPGKYRVIEHVEGDDKVTVQNLETNHIEDVAFEAVRVLHPIPIGLGEYDDVLMVDNVLAHEFIICKIDERYGLLEVDQYNLPKGNYARTYYLNPTQVKLLWEDLFE